MSKRTKELLRVNNALDAQLNKDNQQVMTNIVVYIRSANISEYEQELVRRDITHMLLDAQAEGRTAEEVLGEDAQAFCEAVIAALPPRSQKERVLDSVRNVLLAFVVLGMIWLAYGMIDMVGAQDWPYLPLTLGDVIGQVLILAAAFYIFSQHLPPCLRRQLGQAFRPGVCGAGSVFAGQHLSDHFPLQRSHCCCGRCVGGVLSGFQTIGCVRGLNRCSRFVANLLFFCV